MAPRARLVTDDERVRKLGERTEEITAELSPEEVEAEKTIVLDLLGRRDNLESSRKSIASQYKARIEAVDTEITEHRLAATTRKRQIDVTIEDWLTTSRKVVRVRADNGEVIGRRDARTEELQEALFEDRTAELSFPPPDDVFGK